MDERLSGELRQRLCERLVKGAEGSLKGLRHIGLDRMKKNHLLFQRKKGVCKRILDSNFRLMAAGWNKMMEFYKELTEKTKQKVKFILNTLQNQDLAKILMAYNGMKQRALMLNGVGMGDAAGKKCQLIKRLTNQGYNLQVMATNCLKEFLASERARELAETLEFERMQREKERYLKRIMDSGLRMMGTGFRQAYQFMEADRAAERALLLKQRGIMRRIVDKNTRMCGAAYNKMMEEYKAKQNEAKDKLKFIIAA